MTKHPRPDKALKSLLNRCKIRSHFQSLARAGLETVDDARNNPQLLSEAFLLENTILTATQLEKLRAVVVEELIRQASAEVIAAADKARKKKQNKKALKNDEDASASVVA